MFGRMMGVQQFGSFLRSAKRKKGFTVKFKNVLLWLIHDRSVVSNTSIYSALSHTCQNCGRSLQIKYVLLHQQQISTRTREGKEVRIVFKSQLIRNKPHSPATWRRMKQAHIKLFRCPSFVHQLIEEIQWRAERWMQQEGIISIFFFCFSFEECVLCCTTGCLKKKKKKQRWLRLSLF